MSVEILTKYKCGECGKTHDSDFRAAECCPPEIYEVYVCSICKKEFDFEEDAESHFESDHPDELELDAYGLKLATKAELEAAGQRPLFKQ